VGLQTSRMPAPRTWADTGSAVAQLICAALRWWLDWLSSCGLQWGLNWLTSSALWRGLEGLASNALRRRLGWLAPQWRLRTGLTHFHGASLNGCSIEHLLHAWVEDSNHHLFERTQESSMMPA
jgi:hypothetical protein